MQLLFILLSVLLMLENARSDGDKALVEAALRKRLMKDYDKAARPAGKTAITFSSVTIINFEMHEADHSIDLHTWIEYSWMDPRLQWDPKDNDQNVILEQLPMDVDALWQPDLSVYNAASGSATMPMSHVPILVYAEGKVFFISVHHLHFTCVMDLTYWPHDTHNCSMKLGSWVHNGNMLDMVLSDFIFKMEIPSIDLGNGQIMSRTEWNISETKAVREEKRYACCEEHYVDILISLLITRNAPAFAWTVKMPATCLSILTLAIFLLPPGAGEKIFFGGLCLLLDLLFIDYTSSAINHAPSHTPLIVELVSQQVPLVTVSVLVAAMVVRLTRDPHASGLPYIMKGPVRGLSYLLCLGNYASLASGNHSTFARTVKPDEVELGDECNGDLRKKENSDSYEWLILAALIDRVFFIIYLAICVISLIRFSSVL